MAEESHSQFLAVFVFFAVVIAVFMSMKPGKAVELAVNMNEVQCKKPGSRSAMPVQCNETCMLTNRDMHPNFVFTEQWQLPEADNGAFTFDACAPNGGLVVYLSDNPNNETLGDSNGYAVVLNDQSAQVKSYVGKLPHFILADPRSSLSRVNYAFQLNNDPSACQTYWVIYNQGEVLVGLGNKAGENEVICCLQGDQFPVKGIRYFGFGCLRREDVGIRIRDIRTYDAPAGGCQWLDFAETRCSDLDPMDSNAAVVGSSSL